MARSCRQVGGCESTDHLLHSESFRKKVSLEGPKDLEGAKDTFAFIFVATLKVTLCIVLLVTFLRFLTSIFSVPATVAQQPLIPDNQCVTTQ